MAPEGTISLLAELIWLHPLVRFLGSAAHPDAHDRPPLRHAACASRRMEDDEIPVEPVSAWEISIAEGQRLVIWRPYSRKPGQPEVPGARFALSIPAARRLARHLSEALRLLEDESLRAQQPHPSRRVR